MNGGVSVLLPTRGRPVELYESVSSLLMKADQFVEVLCAVDPDDEASARACARLGVMYGQSRVSAWTAPERFGYQQVHRYVNFLAGEATTDWLMLWNDDARMLTPGWDRATRQWTGRPQHVLFMDAAYPSIGERGNIFPIWPSSWYHLLGYVSLSPNMDVWISELGRRLDIEQRIPVQAVHDRAGDVTHAEGRALMGEGNDPGYDSQFNRAERARAVRLLGTVISSYAP